jgi:hypothetical protein
MSFVDEKTPPPERARLPRRFCWALPEISIFANAAAGTMPVAAQAVIAIMEKDTHCIRTSPIGPTTEGRVISE